MTRALNETMSPSIANVPMKCRMCGFTCRFEDCEADADGDGSPGCPQADCGGIMWALPHMTLLGPAGSATPP